MKKRTDRTVKAYIKGVYDGKMGYFDGFEIKNMFERNRAFGFFDLDICKTNFDMLQNTYSKIEWYIVSAENYQKEKALLNPKKEKSFFNFKK